MDTPDYNTYSRRYPGAYRRGPSAVCKHFKLDFYRFSRRQNPVPATAIHFHSRHSRLLYSEYTRQSLKLKKEKGESYMTFSEKQLKKVFTTERKKKVSLVLRRCLNFIYNRFLEGYQDRIPAKVFDLKFKEEIGWDRLTLKKYLGHNKRIFLIDSIGKKRAYRDKHEPGAFEKFGLLERIPHSRFPHETLAWKITPYFWIKLKEVYPQRKIMEWFVPPHSPPLYNNNEGFGENGNISLTERKQRKGIREGYGERDSIETKKHGNKINNNNNNSERDIFFGRNPEIQKCRSQELTEEEIQILTAKPCEEPDKAKIRWHK